MDILCSGTSQNANFIPQLGKKHQLKSIVRLVRQLNQRQANRRRERTQLSRNSIAPDLLKHPPDSVIQLVNMHQFQWTAGFQILHDTTMDIIKKRKITLIRRLRSAPQSDVDTMGVVINHLEVADLQCRAISNQ